MACSRSINANSNSVTHRCNTLARRIRHLSKVQVLSYTMQLLHVIQTLSPIYSWHLKSPIRMPCFKASKSLYMGCSQQLLAQLIALIMRGVYDTCVRIVYYNTAKKSCHRCDFSCAVAAFNKTEHQTITPDVLFVYITEPRYLTT